MILHLKIHPICIQNSHWSQLKMCESGMQVEQEWPLHKYRHSHLLRNSNVQNNQEHLQSIVKLEACQFCFLDSPHFNSIIFKEEASVYSPNTLNSLITFSTIFLQTFYIHQKKQRKISYVTMTPPNSWLFTLIYVFMVSGSYSP